MSALCFVSGAYAQPPQTFSSGSTGSDGALNYTTPGTYYFNPKAFNPPLDPAGDNVFNFTTINIAKGVTVKLSNVYLNGPVYWLAQGAVTISGTLDLSGAGGQGVSNVISLRVPAAGGPGGYGGGVGGNNGAITAEPGNGPGAGAAATSCCTHNPNGVGNGGSNGTFTGSSYLIPLIGGSGGGGSNVYGAQVGAGSFGGGGGGGGGAILIASSASITYSGFINANGGPGGVNSQGCPSINGCDPGGSGSGGAVRLVAPVITQTSGGDGLCPDNSSGGEVGAAIVRIEAFTYTVSTALHQGCATGLTSAPINVITPPSPASALKVTSLVTGSGTFPINANPFSFPDAAINSSSPVTVNVQAQYIPVGTIPNVIVYSENGPDMTVPCSAGLQGTLTQSTCSASITFPTGASRGFVKATW